MAWEKTNQSVNPGLIVLETSLPSVNPVLIVLEQVRECPCISARNFHFCKLLPGSLLLVFGVSVRVCYHPEASLQPPWISIEVFQTFIGRKSQGYYGCLKDIPDGFKDVTDALWISITDKVRNASCGHIASVADATRTLRTSSRMKNMIRKSLNIFHIRKPGTIRWTILGCVTGV